MQSSSLLLPTYRRHVLPSQHWAAIGLPLLLCVAFSPVMHSPPVLSILLPSSTQTPKVGKAVGCSGGSGGGKVAAAELSMTANDMVPRASADIC